MSHLSGGISRTASVPVSSKRQNFSGVDAPPGKAATETYDGNWLGLQQIRAS